MGDVFSDSRIDSFIKIFIQNIIINFLIGFRNINFQSVLPIIMKKFDELLINGLNLLINDTIRLATYEPAIF